MRLINFLKVKNIKILRKILKDKIHKNTIIKSKKKNTLINLNF